MQIDITYRFGCAPNLFWWQLQGMTDDEIQKYNDKYIKEYKLIDGEFIMVDPMIGKNLVNWNAAIDAAIEAIESIHGNDTYKKAWKIAVNKIKELKK